MHLLYVTGCREDQDRVAQKWMEEQTKYEDAHLGNFRRIYPSEGSEKYDKFFHSSGSLYQETASFKARSECARSAVRIKHVAGGCAQKLHTALFLNIFVEHNDYWLVMVIIT